jgi:hypothetical protein
LSKEGASIKLRRVEDVGQQSVEKICDGDSEKKSMSEAEKGKHAARLERAGELAARSSVGGASAGLAG